MSEEPEIPVQGESPGREFALVEVFGHRRHWAEISDVERGGAKLLRVLDVDTGEIHFYGGAAIFSLTIISQARIDAHVAQESRDRKAREESEARWKAQDEARRRAHELAAPDPTDDQIDAPDDDEPSF